MFGRKKKEEKRDVDSQLVSKGLQKIEGTQYMQFRLDTSEQDLEAIVEDLKEERNIILHKGYNNLTEEEKKYLEEIRIAMINWRIFSWVKKTATAWLRAGDDNEVSERMSDYNQFFSRNWRGIEKHSEILACSSYIHDFSHRTQDVDQAPVLYIQVPAVISGRTGENVNQDIDKVETEE